MTESQLGSQYSASPADVRAWVREGRVQIVRLGSQTLYTDPMAAAEVRGVSATPEERTALARRVREALTEAATMKVRAERLSGSAVLSDSLWNPPHASR